MSRDLRRDEAEAIGALCLRCMALGAIATAAVAALIAFAVWVVA